MVIVERPEAAPGIHTADLRVGEVIMRLLDTGNRRGTVFPAIRQILRRSLATVPCIALGDVAGEHPIEGELTPAAALQVDFGGLVADEPLEVHPDHTWRVRGVLQRATHVLRTHLRGRRRAVLLPLLEQLSLIHI